MTACPECGGPGGVLLLFTVASCEGCSFSASTSSKGMDRPSRVRYVPVVNSIPPRSGKRYAPGLSGSVGAVTWSLNRGEAFVGLFPGDLYSYPAGSTIHHHNSWNWNTQIPGCVATCVVDMGEDPDDWIDVPDGMDWGQR